MKNAHAYIVGLLLISSCINSDKEKKGYLSHADFDIESRVLSIASSTSIDTVLQQVIFLSGIKHDGYGILLDIDGSLLESKIDSLIYKFRKLDINAIHHFNVQSDQTVKNHVLVAIDDAKFIWMFPGNKQAMKSDSLLSLMEAIVTAVKNGGIIVAGSERAVEIEQLIKSRTKI